MNESTFENRIVLPLLYAQGFSKDKTEWQGSSDPEIKPLLRSKATQAEGTTAEGGKPELVYRLGENDLLVLEVKGKLALHSSAEPETLPYGAVFNSSIKDASMYAEDGVVTYMLGLLKEFNVIGLAISGESAKDIRISTFRCLKEGVIQKVKVEEILKPEEYRQLIDNLVPSKTNPDDIRKFATELHEMLRDRMELSEPLKPLLVSGILIALTHDTFPKHYRDYSEKKLAGACIDAIKEVLETTISGKGLVQKRDIMINKYSGVFVEGPVKKHLKYTIGIIKRALKPETFANSNFDLLGHFYAEFLRYSGGDKKGLGIVLTPRHITSLFSRLADVGPKDVILDTCVGTAGFPIAAMAQMLRQAKTNAEREEIKTKRLLGIENEGSMYTLACANMLLRGDGKSNIFEGSCFSDEFDNISVKLNGVDTRPTVTMLNPPYSKKKPGLHELDFIRRACELTEVGGKVFAIIPMSCVCDRKKQSVHLRKRILEKNTLTSVMSMPDGLFPGVGAVTCIICLTAGKPHTKNSVTWFGYWKDDGFEKVKNYRLEAKPWWDIKKTADGWVYPADTTDSAPSDWVAHKKGKIGEIIEGTESAWVRSFIKQEEGWQKGVRVCLSEKVAEMKKEWLASETAWNMKKFQTSEEKAEAKAMEDIPIFSEAGLEWCAEAYMPSHNIALEPADLEKPLKEYIIHLLRA